MKKILLLGLLLTSFHVMADDEGEDCKTIPVESMDSHTLDGCQRYFLSNDGLKKAYADKLKHMQAKASGSSSSSSSSSSSRTGGGNEAQCEEKEKLARPLDANTEDKTFPGSSNLMSCEKMSRGHIRELYSSGGSRKNWEWKPYIEYACCKDKKPEECKKSATNKAKSCESIAYLISVYGRDWNNAEQNQPVTSSGGGAGAANAAKGGAAAVAAASATIKCVSKGIETLDYDACKKFQTQLDLIEGVQQVGYATQELVYKDKIMDSQLKHSSDQNSATGALKATGESLSMQQDMYNQRMAVDGVKLGYLYSIYNDMPKSNDIIAKCGGLQGKSNMGFEGPFDVKSCQNAANASGGFALTMNQQTLDAMKSKLIQIATSAGSNAILASLLGKRADDVNKAIAKIDEFKPIDPFTVSEDEAISTFCKQNPGLPQCLTGGLERTFDTISDNVITFGDGGTGTNYNGSNPIVPGASSDAGGGGGSGEKVTPVGTTIASVDKGGGMEDSTAATVKSGGGGSTGGGGGGGASGGGGGGGGGTPQQPAGNSVTAAVQGKTPTYSGGGGSLSVVGGFGINKKQGEGKEENPFGKLFGKDAPKGTGVVNFRDIASVGKKGDNIFEMISKRYNSVAADKRLMEYELAK